MHPNNKPIEMSRRLIKKTVYEYDYVDDCDDDDSEYKASDDE